MKFISVAPSFRRLVLMQVQRQTAAVRSPILEKIFRTSRSKLRPRNSRGRFGHQLWISSFHYAVKVIPFATCDSTPGDGSSFRFALKCLSCRRCYDVTQTGGFASGLQMDTGGHFFVARRTKLAESALSCTVEQPLGVVARQAVAQTVLGTRDRRRCLR